MLPAAELLGEGALFAPSTVRADQVSNSNGVEPMLDAGAHSVFTHEVPHKETADHLPALLELRSVTGQPVPAEAAAHMNRAEGGGEVRDF